MRSDFEKQVLGMAQPWICIKDILAGGGGGGEVVRKRVCWGWPSPGLASRTILARE